MQEMREIRMANVGDNGNGSGNPNPNVDGRAAPAQRGGQANDQFFSVYTVLFFLGLSGPPIFWLIGLWGLRSSQSHKVWFAKACGWALLIHVIERVFDIR